MVSCVLRGDSHVVERLMELLINLSSRRGGTVHVGRHQIAVLTSVNAAKVVVITAAGCKNIRYLISDIRSISAMCGF